MVFIFPNYLRYCLPIGLLSRFLKFDVSFLLLLLNFLSFWNFCCLFALDSNLGFFHFLKELAFFPPWKFSLLLRSSFCFMSSTFRFLKLWMWEPYSAFRLPGALPVNKSKNTIEKLRIKQMYKKKWQLY